MRDDETIDDLDADFAPRRRTDVVREKVKRGQGRRDVARELGIPLAAVNEEVAQAVREWSGSKGSLSERVAVLHWGLDDIADRLRSELASGRGYDLAPLLTVLLGVHRLRAALLAAEERPGARDEASS